MNDLFCCSGMGTCWPVIMSSKFGEKIARCDSFAWDFRCSVMSSISHNMTPDLIFSPRPKKKHRCHVIRFITFHSPSLAPWMALLSLPDTVFIPLLFMWSQGSPRRTPPPHLFLSGVPSSWHLYIPLFTIASWIHWRLPIIEKSNQSTRLHNERYEPNPFYKYTQTQRESLEVYFQYFSERKKGQCGHKVIFIISAHLYATVNFKAKLWTSPETLGGRNWYDLIVQPVLLVY